MRGPLFSVEPDATVYEIGHGEEGDQQYSEGRTSDQRFPDAERDPAAIVGGYQEPFQRHGEARHWPRLSYIAPQRGSALRALGP